MTPRPRRVTYLAGPEWTFNYAGLTGQLDFLHEITGEDHGNEVRAAVGAPIVKSNGTLSVNAGITWNDAAIVNYYYGEPGIYRGGAALDPFAKLAYSLPLSSRWRFDAFTEYERLGSAIAEINDLVTATLHYAILERADMSLNIGTHNFTTLVPAIAEFVRRDAHREIRVHAEVLGDTDHVVCDVHLMEAVLKNLLYNATRFARRDVRVTFVGHNAVNQLIVDDDGPGIPEKERKRVFESFVQLDSGEGRKAGFGLGLAIVKRTLEWHGGEVRIAQSPLGGARICATWPTSARA